MSRYLLAFTACFIWVLFATRDGLTRLGDSEFYLSAAQYHERGEEMRNPDHGGAHDEFRYPANGIYATWSPLLPVILARMHQVGIEYELAGRIINALCTAATVTMILWLLRFCRWWLQVLAVVIYLTQPPIILSYTYFLSEALSICLTAAFLTVLLPLDSLRHWRFSRAMPTSI